MICARTASRASARQSHSTHLVGPLFAAHELRKMTCPGRSILPRPLGPQSREGVNGARHIINIFTHRVPDFFLHCIVELQSAAGASASKRNCDSEFESASHRTRFSTRSEVLKGWRDKALSNPFGHAAVLVQRSLVMPELPLLRRHPTNTIQAFCKLSASGNWCQCLDWLGPWWMHAGSSHPKVQGKPLQSRLLLIFTPTCIVHRGLKVWEGRFPVGRHTGHN